jgi:AmmeMemoRadiSam system protein B
MDIKRVVMIGPSHRARFRGVSVNLQAGYSTPLGTVPVDLEFAKKLIGAGPKSNCVPQAHAAEHCLEIQVPFLQTVLGDFQIVPILMGEQNEETCKALAGNLAQMMKGQDRTLLLASTDLSHFYTYERARELDLEFVRRVNEFDPEALSGALSSGLCEACGEGAALSVMMAARELGANRSVILRYANSGDVTGDRRRVVGYLSAALFKETESDP